MEKILNVNPEFQGKIPPLTDAEFAQLEANILEAGRVYEPIVVWNGTIVDGHNRYKIVQAHPEIVWETREMNFDDKWAAFDWMYKHQLGRRNLTDEQKTYLLGKLYEARKHRHGAEKGGRGNQYSKVVSDQSGHLLTGRIKEQIANEQGVGQGTVQRAEIFAQGIDAIRQDSPDLADEILSSKKKVKKTDIMTLGKAKPDQKKEMIEKIRSGRRILEKEDDISELESIANSLSDDSTIEFSIENLTEQIRVNAHAFVSSLSNILMDHAELCNSNASLVTNTIDEYLTKQVEEIKRRLQNGTQL